MRSSIIAAMIVAVFATAFAHAQLKEGSYAPDIEAKEWLNTDGEEVSLKQLRGLTVVMYFWVAAFEHRGAKASMDLINIVEANRERGVYVMCVTDADKTQATKLMLDAKVSYPVAVGSQAWKEYEINVSPCVVIVDAEGKMVWTGYPGTTNFTSEQFGEKLAETTKKTPATRTHPKEAKMAKKYIKESQDALRAKKYRDAIKAGKNAIEHALSGDKLKNECQDMLDLVDAIGQEKLARGERTIDRKNFEEGIKMLREVMTDFKGSDAGRRARARLEALGKKHEEVKRILDEQQSEAAAQGKLAIAIDYVKKSDFGPAYDTLQEIIRDTPNGESAKDAKKLLDRMKKNEGVMGFVRDHLAQKDCGPLLMQARNFIKIKNFAKAKELLNQILDKCPDTVFSEDALDELRKLP